MEIEPFTNTMEEQNYEYKSHDASSRPRKGILKITTVDESIHTKYSGSTPETIPVTFENIELREYGMILGDHPSCTHGPPVSIGWHYNKGFVITVEEFENLRRDRRNYLQMAMPRSVREEILMEEFGFSRSQLAAAVRENVKTKHQRRRTVQNLGNFSKMEEVLESIRRKLTRALLCRKHEDLEDYSCNEQNRLERSNKSASFVTEESVASQKSEMHVYIKPIIGTEPNTFEQNLAYSEADRGSGHDIQRRPSGISGTESCGGSLDEYLEKIKGVHQEQLNS